MHVCAPSPAQLKGAKIIKPSSIPNPTLWHFEWIWMELTTNGTWDVWDQEKINQKNKLKKPQKTRLVRMNYTGMKKSNTAKLKITPVFEQWSLRSRLGDGQVHKFEKCWEGKLGYNGQCFSLTHRDVWWPQFFFNALGCLSKVHLTPRCGGKNKCWAIVVASALSRGSEATIKQASAKCIWHQDVTYAGRLSSVVASATEKNSEAIRKKRPLRSHAPMEKRSHLDHLIEIRRFHFYGDWTSSGEWKECKQKNFHVG